MSTEAKHTTSQPNGGKTQARSEALLPADQADPNLEIAEEVSLDLQSPEARRIGQLPPDHSPGQVSEAVAEALKPAAPSSPVPAPPNTTEDPPQR